jgi:hypothetical protein
MDKDINVVDMKWDDINNIDKYCKNNEINKEAESKWKSKILLALMQINENFNGAIKQLNAYDSSSIIKSEGIWLKRSCFSKYIPKEKAIDKILVGQVCIIDYGKTYKNELSYVHYGLCIGKKEEKYFIVPMTTGKKWRNNCYHPKNNTKPSKKYRQALKDEGFSKDCVLMIHDTKFVSGGRIIGIDNLITDENILNEIQMQAFSVCFPNYFQSFNSMKIKLENKENQVENQRKIINNLLKSNAKLKQQLADIKK